MPTSKVDYDFGHIKSRGMLYKWQHREAVRYIEATFSVRYFYQLFGFFFTPSEHSRDQNLIFGIVFVR